MNILILIGIVCLGLLVLRTAIGMVTIIVVGKAGGVTKPVPWFLRVWNTIETLLVIFAYVTLVIAYYR